MFAELLKSKGIEWFVRPPEFRKFAPRGTYDAYAMIRRAMENNEKIFIKQDIDVDGHLSAKCWQYLFNKLSYRNAAIKPLKYCNHNLIWSDMKETLDEGYTTIIIVDSTSNNMELINQICNYSPDIKLLIVDHHVTTYGLNGYPSNCVIINPKMESEYQPYNTWSAGAVNALVCDYILSKMGLEYNPELYLYGYCTMYSDSCDIENPYTVAMMTLSLGYARDLPRFLRLFSDKYSAVNRNFINFTVSPICNALRRENRFDLLYRVFFEEPNAQIEDVELLEQCKAVKAMSEQRVNELMEYFTEDTVQKYGYAVCGILPRNLDPVNYNYTGRLAGKLATKYSCIALCIHHDVEAREYIGSARDSESRDVLSEFSIYFSKSAGHGSAFGVRIEEDRLNILGEILNQASLKGMKQPELILDYQKLSSSRELDNIAKYNEFAIHKFPLIKLAVKIDGGFKIKSGAKRKMASTPFISVVMFDKDFEQKEYICTPRYNGTRIECYVE